MDAPNPSSQPTMASRTPLRIGAFCLTVRDLDRCVDFYRQAVGLDVMERQNGSAVLGIDGVRLVYLEHTPDALPDDKTEAGMFHVAFAMPTRRDLGDWLRHAQRSGVVITRTGDHLVNEAIYYDDPEGNGCECYADRPPETWTWYEDGTRKILTGVPIDVDGLLADSGPATESWTPPTGLRVGHINLRVSDVLKHEWFWCEAVGLDHVGRRDVNYGGRPNAITFMSSGGYHHHVAGNNFTSPDAGPRNPKRAGLAWFTVEAETDAALEAIRQRLAKAGVETRTLSGGGFEAQDPWGTHVRFVRA
jgi:catechol 2,3-dioxygenase